MKTYQEIIQKLELNQLTAKYTIEPTLMGSGAYGNVFSAKEKSTGKPVAIKIMKEFPGDTVDRKRLFREIKALHILKGLSNTVKLNDVIYSKKDSKILGLALVFDRYETNLARIINSSQVLILEQIKFFMYQILEATHYIHSANLVHRDLKPDNILINRDCSIRVCDFGLSRATKRLLPEADGDSPPPQPPTLYRRLTHYVVTRWYRSPELAVGNRSAGEAPADMWSVGCIMAELFLRKPLFHKNTGNKTLMHNILNLLGRPSDESAYDWIEYESIRTHFKQLPAGTPEIDSLLHASLIDGDALSLLKRLLTVNPAERITAAEALQHSFFAEYHQDPTVPPPITFSLDMLSHQEQVDLNDYYQFEVSTAECGQSAAINQQLQAMIELETRQYSAQPFVSRPVTSPIHVLGTVFNSRNAEANLNDERAAANDIDEAEKSACRVKG